MYKHKDTEMTTVSKTDGSAGSALLEDSQL